MERKSKYSPSIRERSSSTIVESVRGGYNNFATDFLIHAEQCNVRLVPEFINKSKSSVSVISNTSFEAPFIYLLHENGRKRDALKELSKMVLTNCSNLCRKTRRYVSNNTLTALHLTMQKYNTISVLKLQHCGINALGIRVIAKMVRQSQCLRDLNLDANPNTLENYYLLCSPSGNLLYLSLKMCNITNCGVEKIANQLQYKDSHNYSKLRALNLAHNHIRKDGAHSIARMLRTNRSLQSLVLTGNRICDDGASLILEELCMSALTHLEIVELRRSRLTELVHQEGKAQSVVGGSVTDLEDHRKKFQKSQRKSSLSGRFKKSSQKESTTSIRTEEHLLSSSRLSLKLRDLIIEDGIRHPFRTESLPYEGSIVTAGNFQIQHLNLTYNRITENTLKLLIHCLYYQTYVLQGDKSRGLLYVSIEGNEILTENNDDWTTLEDLLRIRRGQKSMTNIDNFEDFIPQESKALREYLNKQTE